MSTQNEPKVTRRGAVISAVILLLALGLVGCDGNDNNRNVNINGTPPPPPPTATATPTPSITPTPTPAASVQLSSLGIPAAQMAGPGRQPPQVLRVGAGTDCPVGLDCKKFMYTAGAGWAAVGWWPGKCGQSGMPAAFALARAGACGVNVPQQGRLKSVERISFQVRGERGGEVIGFQVGADDMPPMPKVGPNKFRLTTDWQRHEIDLKDVDLTNAVILFLWVAADDDNPKGAVFYLDDVKFEGTR
jgi:hypothetical protein